MDGDGRRDGNLTVMEGTTASRRRWTARDGASATLMDCDCNGDGWRRTARWRLDGDGRRGATTMDGTTATQQRWIAMDRETVT
jgi:hypothetical protein